MSTPPTPPLWSLDDYRLRLERAAEQLDEMAIDALQDGRQTNRAANFEHRRLRGKASGVRLALSYFDEMQRVNAQRAPIVAGDSGTILAIDDPGTASTVRGPAKHNGGARHAG